MTKARDWTASGPIGRETAQITLAFSRKIRRIIKFPSKFHEFRDSKQRRYHRLSKIDQLREQIDRIDDKFLEMLNRRAKLAIKIGQEKARLNRNNHFHVPHREREIFERLRSQNKGPFPDSAIESVFREICSATLALEKPLKIAFLGPETTFSHQAAVKKFGHAAEFCPAANINGIFSMVEKGHADYGVVPIENSIEGVVNLTLDTFVDSPLVICDELQLGISHCLMSQSGKPEQVREIHSHPQALAQCRHWLGEHFPEAEQIPTSSTGIGAQQEIMLTQDENIVEVKLSVQYVIDDPTSFVLKVLEPEISLQHATQSALRHVVGGTSMDMVLTGGRAQIADEVSLRLQDYLNLYETGILVSKVTVDESKPPSQVQAALGRSGMSGGMQRGAQGGMGGGQGQRMGTMH